MEAKNLAYYCKCFSNLKVNKTKKRGDAVNKPVLLLSVIELISQNSVNDNCLTVSDELVNIFKKYWSVLGSNAFKSSDFALPFFHLKNEDNKFWYLKYSERYDGGRPQTIPKLREDVDYAYIDEDLLNLIQDTEFRQELIDSLVTAWFLVQQKEISDILQVDQDFQNLSLSELNQCKIEDTPKFYLKKSAIRNAFFRKAIVHIYDYRCAFCRLKVTRSINQSIVDGAHIKPFAKFYDSQISNGISLCKNHHWAFGKGWFSVNDNYEILVASDLQEESPNAKSMKEFIGQKIFQPISSEYFPNPESLRWH